MILWWVNGFYRVLMVLVSVLGGLSELIAKALCIDSYTLNKPKAHRSLCSARFICLNEKVSLPVAFVHIN